MRRRLLRLATLALPLALGSCVMNAATGRNQFTPFLPASEESRLGAEQHPEILEQFGGEYRNPAVTAFVDGIARRVAAASDRPDLAFTVTVLDSEIVNAMALPGGYVYITRGLIAVANDEAELAGVIGHEMGHVVARHAAERVNQAVLAQLGVALLGSVAEAGWIADVAGIGAGLFLNAYSREQEFEADLFGVRYAARAGYQPIAMARMLDQLGRSAQLEALVEGEGQADLSWLSTHPSTPERVEAAIAQAGLRPFEGEVGREAYLAAVDGMAYGGGPGQGYVRGSEYLHPAAGFRFRVPPGFSLVTGTRNVAAAGPDGARIVFDSARVPPGQDLSDYIARDWGEGLRIEDLGPLELNGLEAATGLARVREGGPIVDARLVVIRLEPDTVWRFLFITRPDVTGRFSEAFRETALSFRPYREPGRSGRLVVRLHEVRPGETAEAIADRLPFDAYRLERFRVLNNLPPTERLEPGDIVKVVATE